MLTSFECCACAAVAGLLPKQQSAPQIVDNKVRHFTTFNLKNLTAKALRREDRKENKCLYGFQYSPAE